MHNAYIFTVVNNLSSSFKLGSIGAEVGKITQDRGAGIGGQYGYLAPGIPVVIKARDTDTDTAMTKRVKIIEDNELTPVLAATTVYNTVNKTIDRTGGGTATLSYTIRSSNGRDKDITRHNMYYSEDNINEKSIDELYNVLDILKHNEFIDYPILTSTCPSISRRPASRRPSSMRRQRLSLSARAIRSISRSSSTRTAVSMK